MRDPRLNAPPQTKSCSRKIVELRPKQGALLLEREVLLLEREVLLLEQEAPPPRLTSWSPCLFCLTDPESTPHKELRTPIHASMSNAIPESANTCSHSLVAAFKSFSTPRCMATAFVFNGLYE